MAVISTASARELRRGRDKRSRACGVAIAFNLAHTYTNTNTNSYRKPKCHQLWLVARL
jgi:hypothetical protein